MASATAVAAPVALCAPSVSLKTQVSQRTALSGTALPALKADRSRLVMSAERKVPAFITPAAVALLAAAVLPEIAEAAQPGVSPSLKNLLLSVAAGGTVLLGIGGAVGAVSYFDPVKRR